MITPWIRFAIRDEIKTKLAFWGFDSTIRFARWYANLISRFLRVDRPLRDLLDGLLYDADGLPDFIEANEIAIVHISVVTNGYIKIKMVINTVWISATQVIRHARSSQDWSSNRIPDRIFSIQDLHTSQTLNQHFVLIEKAFHFIGLGGQAIDDQVFDLLHYIVGDIAYHTAKAEVVAHHPRARNGLKNVQDQFAFLECIDRGSVHHAEVVEHSPREDKVVLDAGELGHDHADIFGAFGDRDFHQLFDGNSVTKIIAHRVEIVEAVGIWNVLQIGIALSDLVVIAMQITHDRFESNDGLAVERECNAQYAMRGWMMMPHVHHDMVRFESFAVCGTVALKGTV